MGGHDQLIAHAHVAQRYQEGSNRSWIE